MEERYIEINELTRPYLVTRKRTSPEDLKILSGLLHDQKWWLRFNGESPEKKLEMLKIAEGKGINNK